MHIRAYKPEDKERLRYICKETASDNLKRDLKKLEAVPVIYNDYFTEQESDNVFVLCNDEDIPVGYILCSSNPELFEIKMKTEYLKRAVAQKKSAVIDCIAYLVAFKNTPKKYRVHFHTDILPEAQRQGWGTKLMDTLVLHLKSKNIEYLSGIGINTQSVGYKFYKKYGYKIVKKHFLNIVNIAYKIQ